MTMKENLTDIRARLEAIENSIAAKIKEFRDDESVSPQRRERLGALQGKAADVKKKLPVEDGSVWDAVKQEIQHDMDALFKDFDHAVTYIDEHYREKK